MTAPRLRANNSLTTGPLQLRHVRLHAAPYRVTLLIPKSDADTLDVLRRAQLAALEHGTRSVFGGNRPTTWQDSIRDDGEAYRLNVQTNTRPTAVGRNVRPLDLADVVNGCSAQVALTAHAYAVPVAGVRFALLHIRVL